MSSDWLHKVWLIAWTSGPHPASNQLLQTQIQQLINLEQPNVHCTHVISRHLADMSSLQRCPVLDTVSLIQFWHQLSDYEETTKVRDRTIISQCFFKLTHDLQCKISENVTDNFPLDLVFSYRIEKGGSGGGSELSLKIKFEKTLWNCDLIVRMTVPKKKPFKTPFFGTQHQWLQSLDRDWQSCFWMPFP